MPKLFHTKTFWLGAVAIGAAVLKTVQPEYAQAIGITLSPDVLLVTGFGLIFGRDALRKIGD